MLYYRIRHPCKNYSLYSGIYEICSMVASASIAVVFIITLLFRVVEVEGTSMHPTLRDGDIAVSVRAFFPPKRGDIVLFRKSSGARDVLVKRVIATQGQTVDIDFAEGVVFVDGEALYEPYISVGTHLQEGVSFPCTVPEGRYFVMGDNRNRSLDSRSEEVGMVDGRRLLGIYVFGTNNLRGSRK